MPNATKGTAELMNNRRNWIGVGRGTTSTPPGAAAAAAAPASASAAPAAVALWLGAQKGRRKALENREVEVVEDEGEDEVAIAEEGAWQKRPASPPCAIRWKSFRAAIVISAQCLSEGSGAGNYRPTWWRQVQGNAPLENGEWSQKP
mmetsp:Transcript_77113/g.160530  ORF Transcript_77113/g.160530 Transcript_77113/m.160530 type:complete len:147 (+) Transcript_77113:1243-1683(+)